MAKNNVPCPTFRPHYLTNLSIVFSRTSLKPFPPRRSVKWISDFRCRFPWLENIAGMVAFLIVFLKLFILIMIYALLWNFSLLFLGGNSQKTSKKQGSMRQISFDRVKWSRNGPKCFKNIEFWPNPEKSAKSTIGHFSSTCLLKPSKVCFHMVQKWKKKGQEWRSKKISWDLQRCFLFICILNHKNLLVQNGKLKVLYTRKFPMERDGCHFQNLLNN